MVATTTTPSPATTIVEASVPPIAPLERSFTATYRVVVFTGPDPVELVYTLHYLDETTWRSFVAETEITFETVFQPNTEIFTALGAQGMPSTALVSADGRVRHLHTGILTDDLLNELIDEHLGDA